MTLVKPFSIEYETKVLELLQDFKNPNISNEDWKNIWNNPWKTDSEIPGFIMIDESNNSVVGFIGLIYGFRTYNEKTFRTCNLTSWIVKPEYRSESLMLLFPIIKLKGYTITNLSPSKTVCKILERLGFSQIDNDVLILPAIPIRISKRIELSYEIDKSILSPEEVRIYEENLNYQVKFGIIRDKQSYCLFAYKIREKKGIRFVYMLYISNSEFFNNNFQYIRYELFKKTLTAFIMCDSRMIPNKNIGFSFTLSGKFPKFFKSEITDTKIFDNLNSEFVFLNM